MTPTGSITKVLIANRGEIAVRIARACADAGMASVGIYADSDRSSLHVTLVDEAFALNGQTAQETYLNQDKILDIAHRSEADAIHPGYGFLAENAEFAQAVLDAGLTWIGPPPQAIDALGDKVSARHIAQQAGAPLVAGTPNPVTTPEEVERFADQHGFPIAIKAAFGGGGRGLKVAWTKEEIPDLLDSAVREAQASFGRGDCFVERFLDRPRHVETQCLVDNYGTVAVLSTRDCSLQRRHQKLVEEAPAPFLTPEQEKTLEDASRAILSEAGYRGAGTCEFLIGRDGTISFLEVNTRLQVEHPITEEITGVDLVKEQLRIAQGEKLGYTTVPTRGHSFEFRINGEDPYQNFLPAPGTIESLTWPTGPGVRVDTGVVAGDTISGAFDSLIAKIIVTGSCRDEALARARRVLKETTIDGLPTVLDFHRAVVDHADFSSSFRVHTTWIETEFIEAFTSQEDAPTAAPIPVEEDEEPVERMVVEVGGKRLEVVLPASLGLGGVKTKKRRSRKTNNRVASHGGGNALAIPMQGTIVKVAVEEGQHVAEGDLIVVLEAMKMEQPLLAHRSGQVTNLSAQPGQTVSTGGVICNIDDVDNT